MTAKQIKVRFLNKATVPLADNEKVSQWDNMLDGTLSLQQDSISLQGTWKVSGIGNVLGSGILGYLLIRPFFQKKRAENIPLRNVERVVIVSGKKWTGRKAVYHLFQTRDAGMSEVHTFNLCAGDDESAFEQLLKSVVPQDRFQISS